MKKKVIIIHGSKEHIGRYSNLIEKLNKKGIETFAGNLSSHGEELSSHNFNLEEVINSVLEIIDSANIKGDEQVYILGHSFGSFIAKYIAYKNIREFDGIILSGTNYMPKTLLALALFVLKFGNENKVSKLSEKLTYGVLQTKSKKKTGSKEWLSFNEDNFNSYNEDPMCGKDFTRKSFKAMFNIMKEADSKETLSNFKNKNIRQLVLYGASDPVPNFGKEIHAMIKTHHKYEINNHKIIEYKNSKHEILLDNEKDLVINDIIKFIEKD